MAEPVFVESTGGLAAGESLIICSRDRPHMLRDTIADVLAGDRLPAEIVIVDQTASPDPELAALREACGCAVQYTHSPGRGLSRARNEAIRRARHDLLVFTDDDVRVSADWLAGLLHAARVAGPDAIVIGRVLADEAEFPGAFVPTLRESTEPAEFHGQVDFDPLITLNMVIPRRIIERVGGFDERLGPGTRFPAGEDNEFGFRVLDGGYRIVYDPRAVLYHRAWRSESDYPAIRWGYGRGQGAFFAKHAWTTDRFIVKRMFRRLGGIAKRTPGRLLVKPRYGFGDIAYFLGTVSGFLEWHFTNGRTDHSDSNKVSTR